MTENATPATNTIVPAYRRYTRAIIALLGVIVIAAALLNERVGLIVGVQPFSAGQIVLIGLGVLLIAIGLVNEKALTPALGSLFRGTAVLLLIIVITVIGMELVSVLVLNLKYARDNSGGVDRTTLPYYSEVEWGAQYWREHHQRIDYLPYSVWHHEPQTGETINVSERGIRYTPDAQCDADSSTDTFTVFVFGGSTVWGIGAPDWETIPAHMQQILAETRDQPVCVVNYGDMAYVTTQEMVRLTMELQRGNVPDVVIFYDGLNDAYAAYQSGQPAVHQNVDLITARFNEQRAHPLIEWMRGTYTLQLLTLFTAESRPDLFVTYRTMGVETDDLAASVLETHAAPRRIVRTLGEEYGFEVVFFWQPTIMTTAKPLDDAESIIFNALDPAALDLHRASLEAARAHAAGSSTDDRFYVIADIFDTYEGGLWIDDAHIIPPGNAILAQAMIDRVFSDNLAQVE